jgi:hypothetical protein
MGGIIGNKPGTVTSGQTQTQVQGPEQWLADIGQQMANTGLGGFNQAFGQAQNMAGQAPNLSAAGQQNLNTGGNMMQGAFDQAQNWSQFDPQKFKTDFMNPYVNDVVDQIAFKGQRDFNQQAAPSLQAQLGASGNFGSGRATQALQQASRDNDLNILMNQQQAMNQGYQNSMGNYLNAMGQGTAGAQAMAGAGQGVAGIGGTQLANAQNMQLLPGNIFGQFAGGMSTLPQKQQGTQTQNQTSGVAGSGLMGLFG